MSKGNSVRQVFQYLVWRLKNLGRGRSARNLRRKFFQAVARRRPRLVVEVGAFDASTSRVVKGLLPGSRVVAFEANPKVYDNFKDSGELAGSGIEYLQYAVTEEPGTRTLIMDDLGGFRASSSLLNRTDAVTGMKVEVACVSLDTFFSERVPTALWIDVEGASASVLSGATDLLGFTDIVLIEVEDKPIWEGQWMAQQVTEHLAKYGLFQVGRDREGAHQYNILFERRW
jgi:FkbM family methyltransferase